MSKDPYDYDNAPVPWVAVVLVVGIVGMALVLLVDWLL